MNKTQLREELFKKVFMKDFADMRNLDADEQKLDFQEKELELSNEEQNEIEENYNKIFSIKKEIDNIIESALKGYKLAQLNEVDRAILIVAVFELIGKQTPQKVVINEAVKLAKKYGDVKSYKFVNGVLSGVLNKLDEWKYY